MAFLAVGFTGIWAIIRLILVFVLVLILAYYGAKLVGRYQNDMLNKKANIQILESYRIGNNKLIAIARIGNDYYAVGIGKEEINLIDKLDREYMDSVKAEEHISNEEKTSFKEVLANLKKVKNEKNSEDKK